MIINFVIFILYGVVWLITAPLRLFANVSTPTWIADSFSQMSGWLNFGYQILPKTILALLLTWGLFVTIELAIFGYKGFMWILRKIPGIN